MTETDPQTVLIGVFATHRQAERFVAELKRAGFRDDQIGVATPAPPETEHPVEESAVGGALAGGALGVFTGLAVALGMVPGVGPLLVGGGALAGILGGAAVGAAAGGVIGALIGLGIPEEHARHYEQHLQQGRTLVVVKAANRYGEALEILHRSEPHEPSRR
ncbi:MAG: general stress protein [Gemmataceae bacterium]|nr:general stress protein [Gemmataceae bacterium]